MNPKQKRGKYFKKDSGLIKYLSLVEYSLSDLSSKYTSGSDADNFGGNIIHHKLHDPKELNSQVRKPPSFDDLFNDPKMKSRIIMPGDFTADWENMRSKKLNNDDNDEMSNIYEEELFRQSNTRSSSSDDSSDAADSESEKESVAEVQKAPLPTINAFRITDAPNQMSQAAGEKLASLAESRPEQYNELKALQRENEDELEAENEAGATEETAADFIPSFGSPAKSEDKNPELRAMEEYKKLQQERAEELQKLRSEAEHAGFESGYRLGEEKAILQVKEVAGELFNTIDTLLHDLESLRGDILKSASDNFLEIAQAISEALIGHEIQVNPESFKAIITRALQDTLPGDQINIKVSPNMHTSLSQLADDKKFVEKLQLDESLSDGGFTIESKFNTLKADLKSITTETLKQMDLSLMKDMEKVG